MGVIDKDNGLKVSLKSQEPISLESAVFYIPPNKQESEEIYQRYSHTIDFLFSNFPSGPREDNKDTISNGLFLWESQHNMLGVEKEELGMRYLHTVKLLVLGRYIRGTGNEELASQYSQLCLDLFQINSSDKIKILDAGFDAKINELVKLVNIPSQEYKTKYGEFHSINRLYLSFLVFNKKGKQDEAIDYFLRKDNNWRKFDIKKFKLGMQNIQNQQISILSPLSLGPLLGAFFVDYLKSISPNNSYSLIGFYPEMDTTRLADKINTDNFGLLVDDKLESWVRQHSGRQSKT